MKALYNIMNKKNFKNNNTADLPKCNIVADCFWFRNSDFYCKYSESI